MAGSAPTIALLSARCRLPTVGDSMANSFGSEATLQTPDGDFTIFRLDAVTKAIPNAAHLPFSLKILLENLLRTEDGHTVRASDIEGLAGWQAKAEPVRE